MHSSCPKRAPARRGALLEGILGPKALWRGLPGPQLSNDFQADVAMKQGPGPTKRTSPMMCKLVELSAGGFTSVPFVRAQTGRFCDHGIVCVLACRRTGAGHKRRNL